MSLYQAGEFNDAVGDMYSRDRNDWPPPVYIHYWTNSTGLHFGINFELDTKALDESRTLPASEIEPLAKEAKKQLSKLNGLLIPAEEIAQLVLGWLDA